VPGIRLLAEPNRHEEWRYNYSASDDESPEDYFEPLTSAFRQYQRLFEGVNTSTSTLFQEAIEAIASGIESLEESSNENYRESYPKSSQPKTRGI